MNKAANIDEYFAGFPEDVQGKLQKIRRIIKESAPAAQEAISYGMPTFKLNGNLIHFAAYKDHIGLYPAPAAVAGFKEKLKPYHTSKGTIRFSLDKPIPFNLIKKIVEFRVTETLHKNNKY